ncbi:hypothetical protein AB6A23_13470 [Paenibacillus tarimensis]
MIIRKADIHEIDQVFMVLNKATVDLISKGISQWSYPWEPEMISNEVSSNHCFIAEASEVILGVFFIRDIDCFLNDVPIDISSSNLSKYVILSEFQGMGYGATILAFAYSYAQDRNST